MFRPMLAAIVLCAAPLAAPVMAQDAETVVATVNGEKITLGQMIAMRSSLNEQVTAGLTDAALWDLMLDQMIRQTAVSQLGASTMTARDTAAVEIDRRAYLAGAALERVAAPDPTEDELRAAYERIFGADVAPKTEYNAAHILVSTEEEAQAIVDELGKGADFGTLAEERSTDNSGPNKGDLGWFTPDQMVKPFADAVVALEPGGVSGPVQSQFGWHVIKLIDQRVQQPPEFDAVRDQLATQIRRDRVEAEIQRLTAEAQVEKTPGLDASLLNKSDILNK